MKNMVVLALMSFALTGFFMGCQQDPTPEGTEEPDLYSSYQDDYQMFLDQVQADCMSTQGKEGFLQQVPNLTDEDLDGYCRCYVTEFREHFSSKDVQAYINENKPLDSKKLDEIAGNCSIYFE